MPNEPSLPPPVDESLAEKAAGTKIHYDYLDSLRGIAALLVVLYHIGLTTTASPSSPESHLPRLWIFQHGHHAVCLFIILSGFCLTLPTLAHGFRLPRGIGDFFKRRAWRIIPPYYLAILFSLSLIELALHDPTNTPWDDCFPVTPHALITHFLLIQDLFYDDYSKINHAFWSISVEWRIYFLFPFLLIAWRRWSPVGTTLLTLLISGALHEICLHYFQASFTFHFFGLFALGMLAGGISFSSHTILAKYAAFPWGWITLFLALGFCFMHWVTDELLSDVYFGLFSASLLIYISLHPEGWIHRALRFKPSVFVGTFAYSIYLVHPPLVQLLWQYPLRPWQSNLPVAMAALVFLGIPLILGFSYLFYLACERPFFAKKIREVKRTALEPVT